MKVLILFLFFELLPVVASAEPTRSNYSVNVQGGEFTPQYGVSSGNVKVSVSPFRMDPLPVTNLDFDRFVNANPKWSREAILRSPLLADRNYLRQWEVLKRVGRKFNSYKNQPVTNVSWFAASEFCARAGGRLPTVLEWEYVAAASDKSRDASRDREFVQRLLDWYSRPNGSEPLRDVGKTKPNIWGIFDLHGLVWEWTSDFNSVFVSGDNRRDGDQLKNLFCGGGAVSASDKANYAAFMRYALRSSLQGSYVMENLGFRCVYDLPGLFKAESHTKKAN